MGALEKLQYSYIAAGFNPDWQADPYRLLAYTSLQEKATQISHANTGRLCGPIEPMGQNVLAHLAGAEQRHYPFYPSVFDAILDRAPNHAFASPLQFTLNFAIPGTAIAGNDE